MIRFVPRLEMAMEGVGEGVEGTDLTFG